MQDLHAKRHLLAMIQMKVRVSKQESFLRSNICKSGEFLFFSRIGVYVLVKMNSNAIVISKCLVNILYHSVVNYFLHIKFSTCQVKLVWMHIYVFSPKPKSLKINGF